MSCSDGSLVTNSTGPFETSGKVEAGFEPVREAFAAVLAAQHGTGAALAAWYDGRWTWRARCMVGAAPSTRRRRRSTSP